MATYIQGVTDYIPDYQPFQPDLNFIGNYLQTKQNQYDSNFKSLNNLYGKYLYADLTREPNIKKKEEYLKQIDFNLKRVSALDLSIQSNVDQAAQIFTPFYKDPYLMKDMAYTKDFSNKYNAVMALNKSLDPKLKNTYWLTGVEKMMFEKEEFKNSTDDESLQFSNVEYTPYKNPVDTYVENAKKLGISADITKSNGRYFIRKKNGDMIIPSLQNIFAADYASDPALQAVHKAEAYVNRKKDIKEHASEFNGNLVDAERSYLTKQYATIQEYIKLKHQGNVEEVKKLDIKVEEGKKNLETGKGNQFTPGYFRSLDEALSVATTNESYTGKLNDEISNKTSKTATTIGSTPDPLNNISLFRAQVDAGTAAMLAEKDINLAAYKYSRIGIVEDMSPDAYGVSDQNDAYARARQKNQQQHQEKMLDKKILADVKKVMLEQGVKNGSYIGIEPEIDPETGKLTGSFVGIPNPANNEPYNISGGNTKGGATDMGASILAENKNIEKKLSDEVIPPFESMLHFIKTAEINEDLTHEQANSIFHPSGKITNMGTLIKSLDRSNSKQGRINRAKSAYQSITEKIDDATATTRENFTKEYNNNPLTFLQGKGAKYVQGVYNRVLEFANDQKGNPDKVAYNYLNDGSHIKMRNYMHFIEGNEYVEKSNRDAVLKTLRSSTEISGIDPSKRKDITNLFLNSDLSKVSEEEFIAKAMQTYKTSVRNLSNNGGYGLSAQAKNSLMENEKNELDNILTKANNRAKPDAGSAIGTKEYPNLTGRQVADIENKYLTGKFALSGPESALRSLYGSLTNSYTEIIQNGREIKSLSPLFNKDGKGNAMYNTNLNAINVSVNAIQSQGFKSFNEFQKDVSKINFYDQTNNPISFYGANKTGLNDTKDAFESGSDDIVKIAELIIGNYYSKLGDDKTKNFRLASGQIALENKNVGAMVIYPTKDVLDELKAAKDGGIITQEIANAILKNGVTMMSNTNNWKNSLFTRNQRTGLESIVESLDEYNYIDPLGAGDLKISKGTINSLAPYTVEFSYNSLNPVTGKMERSSGIYPPINMKIDNAYDYILQDFRTIAKDNAETWNALYSNSKVPGVSPNNPFE